MATFLLLAAAGFVSGGAARPGSGAGRSVRMAEDPTAKPMVQAINSLTVAINTSPIARFKIGLAKLQAGKYDAVETNAKIDNLIAGNPVCVFSFTTCPFCIKAKQLLDQTGAKYKVVELDQGGGYPIRAELAERTGRTSVPAIFVGGQFVGGCNDGGLGGIVTLDKQGKLRPMLKAAGAL